MRRSRGLALCSLLSIVVLSPGMSLAQKSGSDGINGGYVGSGKWFEQQTNSAIQRGNIQRNLGGGDAATGPGPEVDLMIVFPASQRGLGNVMHVMLLPEDGGAHEVSGLASFDRAHNAITTTFAPRKDVKAGHVYSVVLTDARRNKYPVGRIEVAADGAVQRFKLSAPLLK